jgi:hypothetical protein
VRGQEPRSCRPPQPVHSAPSTPHQGAPPEHILYLKMSAHCSWDHSRPPHQLLIFHQLHAPPPASAPMRSTPAFDVTPTCSSAVGSALTATYSTSAHWQDPLLASAPGSALTAPCSIELGSSSPPGLAIGRYNLRSHHTAALQHRLPSLPWLPALACTVATPHVHATHGVMPAYGAGRLEEKEVENADRAQPD